jgi:hypothetical protein
MGGGKRREDSVAVAFYSLHEARARRCAEFWRWGHPCRTPLEQEGRLEGAAKHGLLAQGRLTQQLLAGARVVSLRLKQRVEKLGLN